MTAADFSVEGSDSSKISQHLRLLHEAGFVSGEAIRSTSTPNRLIDIQVFDLTWQVTSSQPRRATIRSGARSPGSSETA